MPRCGTVFDEEPHGELTEEDRDTLNQLERLAAKFEFQAKALLAAVHKCRASNSTKGLDEMVAFSFNSQQFTPNYGGGGANLPPGRYKGVIADTQPTENSDKQGSHLALVLTPIEGPLTGQKHIDRLNLHHTNPKTVEIANQQLSAYCHVTGKYKFDNTVELHNIPFWFEIGWQRGQEPGTPGGGESGGYTEVKAIYDINGNAPGKAGSGPAPAAAPAAAPPPAAVAPATAPAAGWGAPPATAPAAGTAAAPPAAWGAPPATAPAAGTAPWGAPTA